MRRCLLVSVALLVLLTMTDAARVVMIEDWTADAMDRRGIPSGWAGEAFGRWAEYDFTIEEHAGQHVLHLN